MDPRDVDAVPASEYWCSAMDRGSHFLLAGLFVQLFASVFLLPRLLPTVAEYVVFPISLALLLGLILPSRLVIADDGVSWGRFYRRRFILYASVVRVEMMPKGLRYVLRSGGRVLCTGGLSPIHISGMQRQSSERFAAWKRQFDEANLTTTERGQRNLITANTTDLPYRSSLDAGTLAELAAAPYVFPEVRMMAGRELSKNPSEETKKLLFELSRSTAEPRVRALFEKLSRSRL